MGQVCGCQLVTAPIDLDSMRRSVENLSLSSVLTFIHQVGPTEDGEPAHFQVDEPQTLMGMFQLAEEAATSFDANVSLLLRLGELIPGESHFACVVAAHTAEGAMRCCQVLINGMRLAIRNGG